MNRTLSPAVLVVPALLFIGLVGAALLGTSAVHAQSATDLFFSEYVEGSNNNKALEIYNGTGAPVDLAAGGYNVQMYFNGFLSPGLVINLTGTVAAGDVYVIASGAAAPEILTQADQTNGSGWYTGNDTVVLRRGITVLDVIGRIGQAPFLEWGTGLTSTADNTLRRASRLCAGDPVATDAFDPALQWEGFAMDAFDGLGSHVAACVATDDPPAVSVATPGGVDVPVDSSLTVAFTEPVNVSGTWFTVSCSVSGSHTAAVTGGPIMYSLDPVSDFAPGEVCTLTVVAVNVTDQDTDDPPDTMVANHVSSFTTRIDTCSLGYTPIPAVQGSGPAAAITGPVTTSGIVVGDYEGPSPALRGFYIQDRAGDGDPATSDGIFVFNGDNDSVSLGDLVRVTGTAVEFQGQTQISASTIVRCGTGSVTPVDVMLPFGDAGHAERYEGMLVRLAQALRVTDVFQLGRFGQVSLSSGDRLYQPTSLVAPGPEAAARQAANALNRVLVDDGTNGQNPDPIPFARGGGPLTAVNTLRAGDMATGIIGVMTYTGAGAAAGEHTWRVRPVHALGGRAAFAEANPRPASAPDVGGTLRVAGMNLQNYFNTFGVGVCANGVGGVPTDCRGAETPAEFERQWRKSVAAILATNADVIAVVEVENDGYDPASALADLVGRLNAVTAPGEWAFVDVDAETDQLNALGTDAIKVGLVYKRAAVMPIARTAVLNTVSFVTGGDAIDRNRPALAQAFQTPAGGRFVAVVTHLKSRGAACGVPDAEDGQGECSTVRANAAAELAEWLATDPTASGGVGTLILGDLNAYAREAPLTALESAGFTNLVQALNGASAYSFGFGGQWGYLDHALASPALGAQVTGVGHYHMNADEPSVLDYNTDFKSPGQLVSLYAPDEFRSADHDAVVVGLDLRPDLSGHVTAGGWIGLPPGLEMRLSASRPRVSFALSARYQRPSEAPAVTLAVVTEGGDVRFRSTSAWWLTVAGPMAIVQGSGTINGVSGYSFRVTVVDGNRSGLGNAARIRIWVTSTGDVVYDSGGPRQLAGGSVVIH